MISRKELDAKILEIGRLKSQISQLQMSQELLKSEEAAKAANGQKLRGVKKADEEPPLADHEVTAQVKEAEKLPKVATANRPGVIILGMHRSGTSVIGGLINKMGLKTGGPLIEAAEDNAKGFFERIDVVLQNDELMKLQHAWYSFNTVSYDNTRGLMDALDAKDNKPLFREGRRALAFLNNPGNYPWMLKDPRLCITLRTWLPLLNFIPAILFTYRHPLDVALSLNKRYEHMPMGKGMRLWYVYNKRAIQQSSDLCRVTASHKRVMTNARPELDRIYQQLRDCGVDVPHKVSDEDLNDFIDIKLQHGRSTLKDTSCDGDISTLIPPESWPTTEERHIKLYRESMRVYCAFEDGSAYRADFKWDESIRDDS